MGRVGIVGTDATSQGRTVNLYTPAYLARLTNIGSGAGSLSIFQQ